ncbi:hypothetical protein JCM1841_006208 [Sporobolomyces salmonicolor]
MPSSSPLFPPSPLPLQYPAPPALPLLNSRQTGSSSSIWHLDSRSGTRQQCAALLLGEVDYAGPNRGKLVKVVERLTVFIQRELRQQTADELFGIVGTIGLEDEELEKLLTETNCLRTPPQERRFIREHHVGATPARAAHSAAA